MSRRGWALFVALSVIWGVPYLFIRIAVHDLAPPVVVFARTALAAALLLPVAAKRRALRPLLSRWPWVVAFALVEIAVPFAMLGYAEQRLSSSLTALLISAVPLFNATLGTILRLQDRIDRRRLVGLLVGISGVAALVGIDVGGGDLLSASAALLAALGYAIGPIILSARLSHLPAIGVIVGALALNALWYAPLALLQWPHTAHPAAWGSVGVLAVLCTAIAFLLFFALVTEVGPARMSVITYVNPAVAVLFGVLTLGEPVTVGILVGFPLVLAGSALATRRNARAAAPAPVEAPA